MRQDNHHFAHPTLIATTALLSREFEQRLLAALHDGDRLFRVQSAKEFEERASAARDDLGIVEPGYPPAASLCRATELRCRVPVVAYVRLSPDSVRAALALARAVTEAPVELLVAGYADHPTYLRSRLRDSVLAGYGSALYERLTPLLSSLPCAIRDGVKEFCRTASPSDAASHLAARCATSRAALARRLRSCGIESVHALIIGARLVRGYACLVDKDVPLHVRATALCQGSVSTLRRQVARVTGQTLEWIEAANDFSDFVDRVTAHITAGANSQRAQISAVSGLPARTSAAKAIRPTSLLVHSP